MHDDVDNSVSTAGPWATFGCRVVALLSTMADGGHFVLYVPAEDGTSAEVSVDCVEGLATATVTSATFGATSFGFGDESGDELIGRCQTIADAIVDLVRDVHDLPDPGLLTVSGSAELHGRIGVLGLADRADVGEDHVRAVGARARDESSAIWPTCRSQVEDLVLTHLRDRFGVDLGMDDDGDIALCVDDVRLCVRVADDCPAILLGAAVVGDLRSVQRADVELNVLNRTSTWMRWYRRDRVVWQELALIARPFVPGQFNAMLATFVDACLAARLDLSDRLGAKAAG